MGGRKINGTFETVEKNVFFTSGFLVFEFYAHNLGAGGAFFA
jgi:hypothetical protein